jgi:hypothetical protein
MPSGDAEGRVALGDRGLDRTGGSRLCGYSFEGVGAEQVLQRTGLSEAARRHGEPDELREQGRRGADREHGDVFGTVPAIAGQPSDVVGVIEVAGAVGGHGAEVELAVAGQAGTAGPGDLRAPCRASHSVAIREGVDTDAAVDHRDEMGVRQTVEDGAGRRQRLEAGDIAVSLRFAGTSSVRPGATCRTLMGGLAVDQSVRGLTTFRRAMRQPAPVRTMASS